MSQRLVNACRVGDTAGVIEYLRAGDDPSDYNNHCVQLAALYGYNDILEVLLRDDRIDPSCNDNATIRWSLTGTLGSANVPKSKEIIQLIIKDRRFRMSEFIYSRSDLMQMVSDLRADKIDKLLEL